jgi:hypothetical protein
VAPKVKAFKNAEVLSSFSMTLPKVLRDNPEWNAAGTSHPRRAAIASAASQRLAAEAEERGEIVLVPDMTKAKILARGSFSILSEESAGDGFETGTDAIFAEIVEGSMRGKKLWFHPFSIRVPGRKGMSISELKAMSDELKSKADRAYALLRFTETPSREETAHTPNVSNGLGEPVTRRFRGGDRVRLKGLLGPDGRPSGVIVATDRTSLEAYRAALMEAAGKNSGPIGLPDSICLLGSGTKARSIVEGTLKLGIYEEKAFNVEILSGPLEFRDGWVFASQVASETKESGRD